MHPRLTQAPGVLFLVLEPIDFEWFINRPMENAKVWMLCPSRQNRSDHVRSMYIPLIRFRTRYGKRIKTNRPSLNYYSLITVMKLPRWRLNCSMKTIRRQKSIRPGFMIDRWAAVEPRPGPTRPARSDTNRRGRDRQADIEQLQSSMAR